MKHQEKKQRRYRELCEIQGMVGEVASKARIYNGIGNGCPLRRGEMLEKLRHLRADLDKYQRMVNVVNET